VSDAIKVLGQLDSAATTQQTLYTVPDLTQTTVSSFLYYDKSVAANTTFTAVIGMCLGQKDVVKTYASAVDMTFTLFGVETK